MEIKYLEEYHLSVDRNGNVFGRNNRPRKAFINFAGYEMISCMYNGKGKSMLVHRLVAIAFIPNPENKPQVNHRDGDRVNNNLENLEWVTPYENMVFGVIRRTGKVPQAQGFFICLLTYLYYTHIVLSNKHTTI